MKIVGIRLDRLRLVLDPPFRAAWDPEPRGVPVSGLFGNVTNRLPACMSTGELKSAGARVDSALQTREQGFRAMKIRVGRDDPESRAFIGAAGPVRSEGAGKPKCCDPCL